MNIAVTFTLTVDDLVEAMRAIRVDPWSSMRRAKRSPDRGEQTFVRVYFGHLAASLIACTGSAYLATQASPLWWFSCSLFSLFPLGFIWSLRQSRQTESLRQFFYSDPLHAEPMTVTVDASKIHLAASGWQCAVEWPALLSAIKTKHLILLVARDVTFTIPHRCFDTSEAANSLFKFARESMSKKSN